jgi:putative methanogenesis marker protein 8
MTGKHEKSQDEHVIQAIGKCRIVIRNGRVVEVGDPLIDDCPLAKQFAYPVSAITRENVKANIENRIKSFGMCTEGRELVDSREFVGFGASELLSSGIRAGLIDAVVLACDGAGTVVVAKPEMTQGIGGRMSGLVSTSPITAVMDRIEQLGGFVLDRLTAKIDQLAGVDLAAAKKFKNIAVTVADPQTAETIRSTHPDTVIVAVHVTGLSRDEARRLANASDLVTACASKPIREIAGARALVQAGTAIPVFAMTEKGKKLIIEKMAQSREPFVVKTTRLPVAGDVQPSPLV